MLMLNIVLHNGGFKNKDNPIYLEMPCPDNLMLAIREYPISRCEILFVEKGKDMSLSTPQLIKPKKTGITELNNYKINLG